MEYKSWRRPMAHGAYRKANADKTPFEPAHIFDNLSIIGNAHYACFLVDTADGLIMIDSMCSEHGEYIEGCIRKLGYDPKDVKHLLISHSHLDHFGSAKYFQDKFGTKVWIGENDYKYGTPSIPMYRESPDGTDLPYTLTCRIDGTLTDGGCFEFGGVKIHTFETPGHTPGCISFIFDVYDEGRPHRVSLWGGTGLPMCLEWRKQLLASCDRFAEIGLARGCDAAISTHPFVDNTVERLNVLRNIVDGVANPFVLGYEGYHRFETMYHDMYVQGIAEMEKKA